MTTGQLRALDIVLFLVFMVGLLYLFLFGLHEHCCVRCGGRGRHRDGCPLKDRE